jgi:hypothetical protein
MPSVIDRAVRTLRALDGVTFNATDDAVTVPAAFDDGFAVGLRMVHDREFVVSYDRWRHTFDRAEDAYDCFEFGLSDSCRLRIAIRGDVPVSWHVEKREYGMWTPAHHHVKRVSLAFWRARRVEYRQNRVFQRGP